MSADTLPDARRCPLCGGDNACCRSTWQFPCWCLTVRMPQEVLARIPDDQRRKTCICRDCAQSGTVRVSG